MADQAENLKGACDLEMDKTYSLVVSDAYGLQRYQTEDLFQVRGFFGRLPDLHFISRRGLEYSFTGEKVTDKQLETVYQQLCADWPELKEARFLTCLPSYPSGGPCATLQDRSSPDYARDLNPSEVLAQKKGRSSLI